MKKLLTLCLIAVLALCLVVPSAAMEPPYTPNPYHPLDINAYYYELLQMQDIPEGFVYYEDISFLGEFVELEIDPPTSPKGAYYCKYTLRTYKNEEEPGDYYVGTGGAKIAIRFLIGNPVSEISIPKDQILESEVLDVSYPGQDGEDIGAYGIEKLSLAMKYNKNNKPNPGYIILDFWSTRRDFLLGYYAERKGSPVTYSPFGEFYHQMYLEDHRDDMARTIFWSLHQRDFAKQYKKVVDSYIELITGPQSTPQSLNLAEFSFLGTLKSYQFDEGGNYETGEFHFATPDPEIDIILTVKDLDSTANATMQNASTEIPEGEDLRGKHFCRKYKNGDVVFNENEIVVNNYVNNKSMTLKTSPEAALSNYPMYYDGGGFLSVLFSAEDNEYCSEYLLNSLLRATDMPSFYIHSENSSGTTDSEVPDNTTTDVSSDGGVITDVSTDEGPEIATSDETVTSTDGNPTGSTSDNRPSAPFPWLWVSFSAGLVVIAGVVVIVLIRKRKKQL